VQWVVAQVLWFHRCLLLDRMKKPAQVIGLQPSTWTYLYAFQKKSKSGIKTPPEEIEKVKSRLKKAEDDYADWIEQQKRQKENH
jgi:hypothetical protein